MEPDLDPPRVGDVVAFPGSRTQWEVALTYAGGTLSLHSTSSRRTMQADPARVYVVRRA